jgi:hypothetical protein
MSSSSPQNDTSRPKIRSAKRNYSNLREYKGVEFPLHDLSVRGAHAIGIGRKYSDGKPTGQLALRYYVAKKLPTSMLGSREAIPESIRYVSRKDGRGTRLVTDVIEVPPAQFEAFDPEDRHRPVPGGVSGGISGHTGTIGGWVWDETDDTIVMLSNDHVFEHTAGVDIMQPGSADGGSLPTDKIGDVKRGIARVNSPNVNTVDCAIGDPDSSDTYDLIVHDIGPAVYAIETATLEMRVEKYGQTTEHTYGEVLDVDWSGTVSGRLFEDCVYVDIVSPSTDWSAGGDSGSLVFSQETINADSDIKPVVGLHFAGGGTHGIECKIQNVFSDLNLTTLCAGAFAAFLDSLFETETEGELSEENELRLRTLSGLASRSVTRFTPLSFVRKERCKAATFRFHAGISRELQGRMLATRKGSMVTKFVDDNRAELLGMLSRNGDIRRATVAALRPFVGGATTTTDVLERKFTEQDLQRFEKLAREVERRGSKRLKPSLKIIRSLAGRAEGRSIAGILGLRT